VSHLHSFRAAFGELALGLGLLLLSALVDWATLPKAGVAILGVAALGAGLWSLRSQPPAATPAASIKAGRGLRASIQGWKHRGRGGGIDAGDDADIDGSDWDFDQRNR
jgi:hypothetical protein